jgi:hypothetical protein
VPWRVRSCSQRAVISTQQETGRIECSGVVARIEALFCCQFLALLVAALIERQVRTAMAAAALNHIPLYPELRDCTAPSTKRILEIFTNLARHQLHRDGVLVQTFEPELTTQQQQILDLLSLAPTAYTQHR